MALDEADIAKITALITTSLKADREEGDKARNANVAKAIKAAVDGLKLDERFAAVPTLEVLDQKLADVKPKDEPDKGGAGGDKNRTSVADDPEFKRLKAALDEQTRKAADQARKAEEAEASRKAQALSNSVRDALVASGADPKRVAIALDRLRSLGTVSLNDKGEPGFKFTRDWGEEFVPAEAGAKEWLGTDEGKFFVPATEKKGTGDRVERDGPAARKDGKVDWGSLAGRVNLGALDSLPE